MKSVWYSKESSSVLLSKGLQEGKYRIFSLIFGFEMDLILDMFWKFMTIILCCLHLGQLELMDLQTPGMIHLR